MTDKQKKTAIIGPTIINGGDHPPIENALVIIDQNKIEYAGPYDNNSLNEEHTQINASGKFLLPGLTDAHVHLAHPGFLASQFKGLQETYLSLQAYKNIRSALQCGITTLRGVCDPKHVDLALRSAVKNNMLLGPNLFVAGTGICMTGGHGSQMPGVMHEVDSVDEMRKAIRTEVKAGVDFIKLLSSHRSDYPELSQEEVSAGVEEAHRFGKRVTIHAANFVSTRISAVAGVDAIEHGSFIDEKTADLMAEKNIMLVPTVWVKRLIATMASEMLVNKSGTNIEIQMDEEDLMETAVWFQRCVDQYPKTFELVRSRGIKIAAGTDNVFADMPFVMLIDELEELATYGYSNAELIEAATAHGAEILGQEVNFGQIKEGLLADMVMLDKNPLENIAYLKEINWVMKSGKVVPRSTEWDRLPVKEGLQLP